MVVLPPNSDKEYSIDSHSFNLSTPRLTPSGPRLQKLGRKSSFVQAFEQQLQDVELVDPENQSHDRPVFLSLPASGLTLRFPWAAFIAETSTLQHRKGWERNKGS